MGTAALSAEAWGAIGTTIATLVFLLIPGLVYAYYALDSWIGDDESYGPVITSVESSDRRKGR